MRKIKKPSEFEMAEKGLKKLADLLKELRGTKSYEEVARATGIINVNIQRLESETVKKPNMYILKALAVFSIAYLSLPVHSVKDRKTLVFS